MLQRVTAYFPVITISGSNISLLHKGCVVHKIFAHFCIASFDGAASKRCHPGIHPSENIIIALDVSVTVVVRDRIPEHLSDSSGADDIIASLTHSE